VNGYDLLEKHGIYPSDEEIIGWVKITTGNIIPQRRMIDGVGLEPTFMLKMNRRENINP